jgi:uncharacterized membrane protein
MKRHGKFVLVLVAVVAVAQVALGYSVLPESMASHFDATGSPDAWTGRDAFVLFWLVMLGGLVTMCLGVPWLVGRMPASLINIPHRDYWLAPERRGETTRILSSLMGWMGVGTLVLMMGMWQLTVDANLSRGNLSPSAWWWLVGYFVFIVAWLVALLRAYAIDEAGRKLGSPNAGASHVR